MKLTVIIAVVIIALVTWDMIATQGKYRREMMRMGSSIATAYHVR